MGRQGALGAEAGEDSESVDALAHAAADRQVDLAQAQHLRRVDQPQVARGAGGPDRVGGPGDAQVQRDFAGGVVGDRPRVVIMRPEFDVVVEFGNRMDLVLRLHVAVLGAADVDAHPVGRPGAEIETGVLEGLPGAVDADAARPGVPTRISFFVW